MPKYADVQAGFRGEKTGPIAPALVVNLSPNEFADEWKQKPRSDIAVGLRLLPSDEDQTAHRQAAKRAVEAHPKDHEAQEAEYTRNLKSWAVARCLCDPNDVKKPHSFFPMAEDTVPLALTESAITRIFDEIERHHVNSSPLFPEANDDEVAALAGLLAREDPFGFLPQVQADRCRRYAHFILSEFLDFEPPAEDEDQESLPDA